MKLLILAVLLYASQVFAAPGDFIRLHLRRADIQTAINTALEIKADGGVFEGRWRSMQELQLLLTEVSGELAALRQNVALFELKEAKGEEPQEEKTGFFAWLNQYIPEDESGSYATLSEIESLELHYWLTELHREIAELTADTYRAERQTVGNKDHRAAMGDAFVYRQKRDSDRRYLRQQLNRARTMVLGYYDDNKYIDEPKPHLHDMMLYYNSMVVEAYGAFTEGTEEIRLKALVKIEETFDLLVYEFDTNIKTDKRGTYLPYRLRDLVDAKIPRFFKSVRSQWRRIADSLAARIKNNHQEQVAMAAIMANADISKASWLSLIETKEQASAVVAFLKANSKAQNIDPQALNEVVTSLVTPTSCDRMISE